ncbi:MAG: hypothetical protein PW791_06320 [Neorhizobium sp.]|nr:hypothetical protein [Neorhizobium sp.]
MRFFRQIIADRMSGGALAMLLCVLIVLQGLLADRTMAAMETMGPDHGQIICGAHDVSVLDHDHHDGTGPAEQSRKDCCLAACQVVQGFAAGLAVTFVVLANGWPQGDDRGILAPTPTLFLPRNVSIALGARGPPLSVPA